MRVSCTSRVSSVLSETFCLTRTLALKSYLCISSTAAYELTHRKDFPVCRLGSSIRIPTQLFLAWVDKHTHVPADLAVKPKEANIRVG